MKGLGIVEASYTIKLIMPLVTRHVIDYDNLVAMAKTAYSYQNILSLFHDLLDNIGFMYGIKVLNRTVDQIGKSFLNIFNPNVKKLSTSSKSTELNDQLEKIYLMENVYSEVDNEYKHKFYPGLIHLRLPESVIRQLPEHMQGGVPQAIDLGAVPTDKVIKDVETIRDEILPLALSCVIKLIDYRE